MKFKDYIKYGLLGFLFIGLVFLYALEFPYFSRYLTLFPLLIISLFIGLGSGIYWGYRFRDQAKDLTDRIQITVFFTFIILIFMPLLISLSNRLLKWKKTTLIPVELVEQQGRISDRYGILKGESVKPNAFKTFFYLDGKLRSLQSDHLLYPEKERGDTVFIKMEQGLWGMKYLETE